MNQTAVDAREAPGVPELAEQAVLDYLMAHPDLFARHPDVLEKLELAHSAGSVSYTHLRAHET